MSRVHENYENTVVAVLTEIREAIKAQTAEVKALNVKIDALTGNDGNPYIRTLDQHEC